MAKNEIEVTAKIGMVTISTANSNLDGSGTLGTVVTGVDNGMVITRVYIKATVDTSEGMVRLFLYDGTNTKLIKEVRVEAVDQRGVTPAFARIVRFRPGSLFLPLNWSLKASTQVGSQPFNVIANGYTWDYPVSETSIDIIGDTAATTVTTANSNLDGTGTLSTLITGANEGSSISMITIKRLGTSTLGMIRLFMFDGTNTKLFMEIHVPASTQSGVVPAFSKIINFRGGLWLPASWSIKASTEVGETFAISAISKKWSYS